jgi:hypothetical protein
MHYIKLLRPPNVGDGQSTVDLVLAITTDLYDAYLAPPQPLKLSILGLPAVPQNGDEAPAKPVNLTPTSHPVWKAGMRVLKVDLRLPAGQPLQTLQIRPLDRSLVALTTEDIKNAEQGVIIPVYVDLPQPQGEIQHVSFRSLRLAGNLPAGASPDLLQVEEDLGESMARHVWDGGLAAVCLLADLCQLPSPASRIGATFVQERQLNILELGCGIGTLGLGAAHILSSQARDTSAEGRPYILMTDLADAEARARANIARFAGRPGADPDRDVRIDFESLDWAEGEHGRFGDQVIARAWDVVAVSDCTYNSDTLPMLVKTLSAVHAHSVRGLGKDKPADMYTKFFVGTKPRHSSENAVFELLKKDGWVQIEQTSFPLRHLGGQDQSFDAYLFEKR